MTVSLRLQEIFPEPTPELKGLIDVSSLSITGDERTCINAITDGWGAYQTDHTVAVEERQALGDVYNRIVGRITVQRTHDEVVNETIKGVFYGAVAGGVVGGVAGGVLGCKLSPTVGTGYGIVIGCGCGAVGGAIGGGLVGGATGYEIGQVLGAREGRARAEATVTRMPIFRHWKTQKYQVILPALMRSMTMQEREPFNLECPITHDFMEEPVRAADDHYYERKDISAWLAKWDRDYPPERLAQLTEEERRQIFLQTSPSNSARIDAAHLYLHPDYYDDLYDRMKAIYNGKIGELHLSLQGHASVRSEMAPMVRFYQTPLEEREELIDDVKSIVRRSHILQHEEKQQIRGLFDEAVEPPPALL